MGTNLLPPEARRGDLGGSVALCHWRSSSALSPPRWPGCPACVCPATDLKLTAHYNLVSSLTILNVYSGFLCNFLKAYRYISSYYSDLIWYYLRTLWSSPRSLTISFFQNHINYIPSCSLPWSSSTCSLLPGIR